MNHKTCLIIDPFNARSDRCGEETVASCLGCRLPLCRGHADDNTCGMLEFKLQRKELTHERVRGAVHPGGQ